MTSGYWTEPPVRARGTGPSSPLEDITRGNNTVTFRGPSTNETITVPGCNETRGYDLTRQPSARPKRHKLVAGLAGLRAARGR